MYIREQQQQQQQQQNNIAQGYMHAELLFHLLSKAIEWVTDRW